MGRIQRVALPEGPHRDLMCALQDLHLSAGQPGLRSIAKETALSHDTVHRVLRCAAVPGWGALELVVEELGGDVETFHRLWMSARAEADRRG